MVITEKEKVDNVAATDTVIPDVTVDSTGVDNAAIAQQQAEQALVDSNIALAEAEAQTALENAEKAVENGLVALRHSLRIGTVSIGDKVYKIRNYLVNVLPEHVESFLAHGLKIEE